MAPSFGQGVESFKEKPELEQQYISGLRENCCSKVDALYAFCGEGNEKRPLIGVLKTQEELDKIGYAGGNSAWRYQVGLRHDGVYFVSENIRYAPFAISLSSDKSRLFLGIEVVVEDAGRYLGGLYNRVCSEGSQTLLIENPGDWDVQGGEYQLFNKSFKGFSRFLRKMRVMPSLIIACDITETNFGQVYLKS